MDKDIKIMFFASTVNPDSGIGNFAYQLIRSLKKLVKLNVVVSRSDASHDLDVERILPEPMNLNMMNVIKSIPRLAKLAKKCDVIHCLDERYLALAGLVSIFSGKPYVIHSIGTYSILLLKKRVLSFLYKYLFKKAHKVICISHFTKDSLIKRVKLSNAEVIFPGVAEDYFLHPDECTSSSGKKDIILLSVGAVKGRKGYDISLSAFAQVKKKVCNLKYIIVGEIQSKNFYSKVERIVKENKIENDVVFKGKITKNELIALYRQCDIFILTPRYIHDNFEGFGLVFLEAGASGKPVIATATGGIPDAVADGDTGILVPEEDIQAAANALEELVQNEELRRKIGFNGYQRAKQFTWDRAASQIVRFYMN